MQRPPKIAAVDASSPPSSTGGSVAAVSTTTATAGMSILSTVSFASDLVMVVGTSPGWISQLRQILTKGTAEGFSWHTTVLLLSCYTLRVGYYFGAHFHWALLLQCFVMIAVVLCLLAAIADAPDPAKLDAMRLEMGEESDDEDLKPGTHSRSTSTASITSSVVSGAGKDPVLVASEAVNPASWCEYVRKLISRRWAGGRVYFGVVPWAGANTKFVYVTYLVMLLVVVYFSARQLPKNKSLSNLVGFIALGLEASVTVPQVLMMERQKSVAGLSRTLLVWWCVGDAAKVLYFIAKAQPMPFVVCGVTQFSLDLWIIGQIARFAPKTATATEGTSMEKA